ncbi:nanos homolog 3-like [Bradysia coprophila]|uniref:nanos homolog 3-like n=1 Tax=Bradysia coprophila TaxID=38358 RepID=UPI00187D8396|nr:nanos homolog 3-like [Bradysia coprophila]
MDDQYRMIIEDIESLLNESCDMATPPADVPVTMKPFGFLPYKCFETLQNEAPILGLYRKWSTVESDEFIVQHHSTEQRTIAAPPLPVYNWTVEMMQSVLLNFWNARLRQNMMMTKRTCSFCKKNGMNYAIYSSHSLRLNGVLQCPYLLKCQCSFCFKNGHTTSYCPLKAAGMTGTAGIY